MEKYSFSNVTETTMDCRLCFISLIPDIKQIEADFKDSIPLACTSIIKETLSSVKLLSNTVSFSKQKIQEKELIAYKYVVIKLMR